MRLIDADALILELQKSGEENPSRKPIADGFISILRENCPTIESPRDWTPCAEGLPEIMKRVIVTICGEIVIAEREHELDDDETTPIHWYDDDGCRFNDDVVTAWIPLPEPWTGGLDGK